jgi:plasmid stabilization system protein ParE
MKVRYSKLALAELDAILSNLAIKNPTAAQRFEDRIRQVGERIGRFPQGFQEVAERRGVRRVPWSAILISFFTQWLPAR